MCHNAAGFLWTSNLYLKLLRKRTLKASVFSRKQLENESLAEVQFMIDSCRLVTQSNYLNNYNKDCDGLVLACFIREQCKLVH